MKINMNVGLKGCYRIVVSKDAEMKEVVQDTGFFENIITDAGLHALATFEGDYNESDFRKAFFKEIYIGSGATAPTAEDEALENLVATGVNPTYFTIGTSESLDFGGYVGVKMKKQFNKGDFVGMLSEVGLGVDTPTVLFSRALVVDESGTPTPITVTANDFLTVIYTVRQYIPFAKTFNISANIDGTPTPMEVRVQPYSSVTGQRAVEQLNIHPGRWSNSAFMCFAAKNTTDVLAYRLDSLSDARPISFTPYDEINKPFESWGKLIVEEGYWNDTIKTVVIRGLPGSWQLRFTPEIVKTAGKTMEIEFGVKLGRYE